MSAARKSRLSPAIMEMDTEALFEKFTIEEIRKVEQETRAEIEKKKEDLRQMVGERYRDLIEAADTISDMKNCAGKIVQSVQTMQTYTNELQQTHMTRGISAKPSQVKDRSVNKEFYGIASQIKLLLDMPEKIWSSIESSQHLKATQLYLLACHIVSSLQLDSSTQQSAQLLAWFPLLSRQWTAISHFKGGILQSCRNILKNASVSDQGVADALCSIMLLEDSSPRQVFTEFLLARKTSVQQCFHSSQHGTSIKSQVCGVIEQINITLRQIYAVFYHQEQDEENDSCNLLLKTLQGVVNPADQKGLSILSDDLMMGSFTKHLPTSITGFKPSLRTPSTPIAAGYLQQSVEQWVETCIKDVHNGVGKLLNYVASIKALTSIRDELWELLAANGDQVSWDKVCKSVVNRRLSLWEEFIRPLFLTRVQAITQDSLDKTCTSTQQLLTQALQDMETTSPECDIASYVWKELGIDMPSPSAWKGRAQNKQPNEAGGLYMKSRAFTPRTQSICSTVDSQLKTLLDDLAYYTTQSEEKTQDNVATTPTYNPFDKYADCTTLQSFLQISCSKCIHRILDHVKKALQASSTQLDATKKLGQNQECLMLVDRALLLGRFCVAMTELSPHLEKAILISEEQTITKMESARLRTSKTSRRPGQAVLSEDNDWMKIKLELLSQTHESYNIWNKYTCSVLLDEFKTCLMNTNGASLLKAATHWDTIEIEEETEDGKKVSSKIRLPVQGSWYVQSLLYGLCEEINRVGGHALSRSAISNLVSNTSSGLVVLYEDLVKEKSTEGSKRLAVSQSQALQMLFDLRFITVIMSGRNEESKSQSAYTERYQKLIQRFEGVVDPFDLDVFSPHLQANLNRHTNRCTMLLGALASADKHLYSSHRAASSGFQEQHNVLPLASSQGRFTLLPLSSSHNTAPSHGTIPRPQAQPLIPSSIKPSTPEPILHKSRTAPASLYSKFGSLKSGWLANIGGQ
ncbi:conserved oligomeric Golgi complex subunit 1-like [Amphiura filiformis]|uniref:conserved oligomeric Golgi complex subunit 1-like n=1 Tax=Amphiura filiformis TaxID=82378 RepID=UPI003B228B43